MKYEIEPVFCPEHAIVSEICTLTGLPIEDVLPIAMPITRWNGKAYIETFRKLGFNCNPRFVKFDRDTHYPCLMRTRKLKVKNYWFGFVYYDGRVYVQCAPFGWEVFEWADWNACFPNYKITSMLQVWI